MFTDKSVFVIGAGASCEFEMPSGAQLAAAISANHDLTFASGSQPKGDGQLAVALEDEFSRAELPKILPVVRNIAAGVYMAETIDAYIDRHRKTPLVPELGKFLIAHYLLAAERASTLKVDNGQEGRLHLPNFGNTWLDTFARVLLAGHSKGEEEEIGRNITIICFNYDRCIERYLQQAIASAFHIDPSKADAIVRRIRILRPYGDLGRLPPSPSGSGPSYVPFGAAIGSVRLREVSCRLKTFTERVEDDTLVDAIHDTVREAKNLVFLGFGFHAQNMQLLNCVNRNDGRPQCYFSGMGIPEQAVTKIVHQTGIITGIGTHSAIIRQCMHFERDKTAGQIMQIYRRALAP